MGVVSRRGPPGPAVRAAPQAGRAMIPASPRPDNGALGRQETQ